MNDYALSLLMYLDEGLVTNMTSFVLNGYIEARTSRIIQDRTLTGRAGYDEREHIFDECRNTEDERQGFRGNNCVSVEQADNSNSNNANFENREFIRREEEIKRIFTTFNLHGELFTELDKKNSVKYFDNTTIEENMVKSGDYVRISGNLTSESINTYLDSLVTIFDCFGCDNLNKLAPIKNNTSLNYGAMKKIFSHLSEILNKNSTQDLILNCGDTPIILNVNNNFFLNNNAYIFDKVDCPCTVFGKVIKVAPHGECISLLRKTAQYNFYEKLLKEYCPYCNNLNSSGIIIPDMPRLKCEGISLIVVPISISM